MIIEDIKYFYGLLEHTQTEIRVFGDKYPHGKSIYVSNEREFIDACKYFTDEQQSLYAGINERTNEGKNDKDVISCKLIPVDIDSKDFIKENQRKKVYEFLDSEKEELKTFINDFEKFCSINNFKWSCKINSGHGLHYYFEIQKIDDTERIKKTLDKFKEIMISTNPKVDTAIFNPSRIMRIPGTINFKDKLNPIESKILDIKTISSTDKFNNLKFIDEYTIEKNNKDNKETTHKNRVLDEIKKQVNISSVLKFYGYDIDRHPTECLLPQEDGKPHYSEKKSCFSWNDEMGVFNCWHCGAKGDHVNIIMQHENLDFNDAVDRLKEIGNVRIIKKEKVMIELPRLGRLNSRFFEEVAKEIKGSDDIFYKSVEDKVVELRIIKRDNEQEQIVFSEISPPRLINIIENKIIPVSISYKKKDGDVFEVVKEKSANENLMRQLKTNDSFINSLSVVNRFFEYPAPHMINNKLYFTNKGYNKEMQCFVLHKMDIDLVDVNTATLCLKNLLSEFCFKTEQDLTIALSYLITPACRGLYNVMTARTPLFLIQANMPGAGKDYLAATRSHIYQSSHYSESPIVTSKGVDDDEVRKRIDSALISGQKIYHSENNAGFLHSRALETVLTANNVNVRILGKSEQKEIPNEIDFSLSANIGLSYSQDLVRRLRIINLFYSEEDINERKFNRVDLLSYVHLARAEILSAIYSLIKNWVVKGCPEPKHKLTSYPEWSRVVGGIMETAGLDSPCTKLQDDYEVGGDNETRDYKKLYKLCYSYIKNGVEFQGRKFSSFKTADIFKILMSHQLEMGFFNYYNDDKSSQTKFGLNIRKYVNRALGGIRLVCIKNSERASLREYDFVCENDNAETYDLNVSKSDDIVLPKEDLGLDGFDNVDDFK